MDIGWSDIKTLLSDIVKLTSNVKVIQSQLDRTLEKVEAQERELLTLRADLRVAEARLEAEAVKAAAGTVIQAHESLISRILTLEKELDHHGTKSSQLLNNTKKNSIE
ncbi:hypothetical protein [Hyphomonas sp. UBA1923]|uniref:hypothetical protein n=1 Tax=Hyphomonas sp. UBA1923 TaxID=1946617 RepID=UPI0025BC2292|nr:hypothetical protein [Hyphomonas sp. UBA1923]|tara:strand:+ start:13385 stop:13708 length:324 start_codon:yes stop_codon:yes gene_type:complete